MIPVNPLPQPILSNDVRNITIEEVLAEGHTGITNYCIARLAAYGRAVLIDGLIQSTEFDEALYHEMLVSPACAWHGAVRRAVVIGGANGGIMNRLRHLPQLETVHHVDIDPVLYRLCQFHMKHLKSEEPTHIDYRLEFVDPDEWVSSNAERLAGFADLILLDLPDITSGSYAAALLKEGQLQALIHMLTPGGVLVTHVGHSHPCNITPQAQAVSTLHTVAEHVVTYDQYVPSLGVPWGFAVVSNDARIHEFLSAEMEAKIADLPPLMRQTYDFDTHVHMTTRSSFMRRMFDGSKGVAPKGSR